MSRPLDWLDFLLILTLVWAVPTCIWSFWVLMRRIWKAKG